jgi:hypothetical protein
LYTQTAAPTLEYGSENWALTGSLEEEKQKKYNFKACLWTYIYIPCTQNNINALKI